MRISDWSSDVCSPDLLDLARAHAGQPLQKGEISADREVLALGGEQDRACIAVGRQRGEGIADLAEHFGRRRIADIGARDHDRGDAALVAVDTDMREISHRPVPPASSSSARPTRSRWPTLPYLALRRPPPPPTQSE